MSRVPGTSSPPLRCFGIDRLYLDGLYLKTIGRLQIRDRPAAPASSAISVFPLPTARRLYGTPASAPARATRPRPPSPRAPCFTVFLSSILFVYVPSRNGCIFPAIAPGRESFNNRGRFISPSAHTVSARLRGEFPRPAAPP